MGDIFSFLFDEKVILLRTVVYTFGWVVLSLSTIVLIYKSAQLYKKTRHLVFGKLIVPILIGWLVTMHSLGAVCTFYVFDMPKKGMLVTFPIFLIWMATVVAVFFITSRWGGEAIKKHNEIIRLNKELEEANERLQQLDELKSEFINIAAHQLRTPLSEIKWALGFIINDESTFITPEKKEILIKSNESNEKIIKIINSLLETGKAKSGNLVYNFKECSIEKIIRNAVKDFSSVAEKKKIGLYLNKSKTGIPNIEIDPVKINIAVSILIENALNYTPEYERVEITIENRDDHVRVAVKDNGIGISEKETNKVFTRFFRSARAIKVQTDGTGLGLHIAKNIIEAHKGKIWFESKEGKGTTFYFTIPFERKK